MKNVTETFSRDEALAEIRKAKEALDSGAEFSKVAEQFSDCPGDGGDLGWFAREAMVEEFDDNVFPLAEGETSGVFETRFGFHIARLNGRRPAGIQPLSLLRETIAHELFERRKRRALDHYFDALLSESRVEWRAASSMNPCCVPSRVRAALLEASREASAERGGRIPGPRTG